MADEALETETPQTDEVTITPEVIEAEKPEKSKEFQAIEAQKHHWKEKAEKAEARSKELEAEVAKFKATQPKPAESKSFGVEDLVEVTNALEGLDSDTKQYLVKQHKITGKQINEIKQEEDFATWLEGHKVKVEKNKTLNPSTRPSETTREKGFTEKLEELDDIDINKSIRDLEAKQKLLEEKGMWKDTSRRFHSKNPLN